MKAEKVLVSKKPEKESKTGAMGTRIAEYSEAGPFSCMNCWYLQSVEPKKESHGLCSEEHMLRDPEVKKKTSGGKKLAVVNKFFGCCRYVDPVVNGDRNKKFVFAGSPEEEAKEHGR
jgi:hypothetical protein